MIYETLLTVVILYLVQCCLCGVVHIINGSKQIPETPKDYVLKTLNIFWVLFNLKKLREA